MNKLKTIYIENRRYDKEIAQRIKKAIKESQKED